MHKERTRSVYENEQMLLEGQEADALDQSHGLMVHCCRLLPCLMAGHRIIYKKMYWNDEKNWWGRETTGKRTDRLRTVCSVLEAMGAIECFWKDDRHGKDCVFETPVWHIRLIRSMEKFKPHGALSLSHFCIRQDFTVGQGSKVEKKKKQKKKWAKHLTPNSVSRYQSTFILSVLYNVHT